RQQIQFVLNRNYNFDCHQAEIIYLLEQLPDQNCLNSKVHQKLLKLLRLLSDRPTFWHKDFHLTPEYLYSKENYPRHILKIQIQILRYFSQANLYAFDQLNKRDLALIYRQQVNR